MPEEEISLLISKARLPIERFRYFELTEVIQIAER
jgi:hypothetical protein